MLNRARFDSCEPRLGRTRGHDRLSNGGWCSLTAAPLETVTRAKLKTKQYPTLVAHDSWILLARAASWDRPLLSPIGEATVVGEGR
jgi:hypothetical protein